MSSNAFNAFMLAALDDYSLLSVIISAVFPAENQFRDMIGVDGIKIATFLLSVF
jgi:hypothetical protein